MLFMRQIWTEIIQTFKQLQLRQKIKKLPLCYFKIQNLLKFVLKIASIFFLPIAKPNIETPPQLIKRELIFKVQFII